MGGCGYLNSLQCGRTPRLNPGSVKLPFVDFIILFTLLFYIMFTDPLFVIMEYVSHGKLQSFLRSSRAQRCYDNMHGKSSSLTSRHLTSFCYQVARGMQFLSSKGVNHIFIWLFIHFKHILSNVNVTSF
jgi:serine/threonine protein kinase